MGAIEQARLDVLKFVNERRLESLDEYVEILILFLTAAFFLIGYAWVELSNMVNLFSLVSTVLIFFFYKIAKALHAIDLRLLVINTFVQLLTISLLLYFALLIITVLQNLMIDSFRVNIIVSLYLILIVILEQPGKFAVTRAWSYIEIENNDGISNFEKVKIRSLYLAENLQFNSVFFYVVALLTMAFGLPVDENILQIALYIFIPSLIFYVFYKYYRYRKLVPEVLLVEEIKKLPEEKNEKK